MSLERLPIGRNGMYKERKTAKDGAVYAVKEYDPITQKGVISTIKVVDQNTVEYHTTLGPVTLRNNQINSILPSRLRFFPRLGRRPFDLTWRPNSQK